MKHLRLVALVERH